MPKFSEYFSLKLSQYQLDFIDISNEYDTPVYVDPYAIEIRNDLWSANASEYIRVFFLEVLDALRKGDDFRARSLMSHMGEPKETFLGESKGVPKGRGVGNIQANQLIDSIKNSKAYSTGLLSDLSEMSLFVDYIDRDKISDLTTNIIRNLLVDYTQEQCDLHNIETQNYNGPALWDNENKNWVSKYVQLPYINESPIILVPKYIVRRRLSLDSQEFYNKQITDFLIAENLRANTSLVQTLKEGDRKVYKKDVREENPKSKTYIAEIVKRNPKLLEEYKEIARKHGCLTSFSKHDEGLQIEDVCNGLAQEIQTIDAGRESAEKYHKTILGILTVLFYPDLIDPRKEWSINSGRKRVDIVYTNASDSGFFSQRRNNANINANVVIVECKNYTNDIENEELDQLLGRFDNNRGKFGIITCRSIDKPKILNQRCIDASGKERGYIIVLTDDDIIKMLQAKPFQDESIIENTLYEKFRILLS